MDFKNDFKARFFQNDLFAQFEILYRNMTAYMMRFYVFFWHRLSLDERVRASPYVPPPKNEIQLAPSVIWYYRNLRIFFLFQHIVSFMALYWFIRGHVKIATVIMVPVLLIMSMFGIVCGAHRLWCHNTYKANWSLRLFLMLCQTLTSQYSIYNWVRDHRLHHKFSDTPLDPHDSNRGFFFSHIGWLLMNRAPEAKIALKNIYIKDLEEDEIVMLQHRYYWRLTFLICYILPGFVPWYFWNESFLIAHFTVVHLRMVLLLHMTFTVNSVAHIWGMKPFDRFIAPVDNRFVWFSTMGTEGWHNYHHVFPWDYKPSEFWGYRSGLATVFIEFCTRMGWAYDLKTTSVAVQTRRRQRTGNLSCNVFGWNDTSLDPVERALTHIHHRKPVKND